MMRTDNEEVLDYVLRHYIGWGSMEYKGRTRHMRLFKWSDEKGTWMGNRRAFYLHVARHFGFRPSSFGHDTMNRALVAREQRVYPEYDRTGDTAGARRFFPPAGPIKKRLSLRHRRAK